MTKVVGGKEIKVLVKKSSFKSEKCYRLPYFAKVLPGSKFKIMNLVPTSPSYITDTEVIEPKISLKYFNSMTNGYNNLMIDPFSSYFETIPTQMKPISSINNYY